MSATTWAAWAGVALGVFNAVRTELLRRRVSATLDAHYLPGQILPQERRDPMVVATFRTTDPALVTDVGFARPGPVRRWRRKKVHYGVRRAEDRTGVPLPVTFKPDGDLLEIVVDRGTAEREGVEPHKTWVMWVRLADRRLVWSTRPFDMRRQYQEV